MKSPGHWSSHIVAASTPGSAANSATLRCLLCLPLRLPQSHHPTTSTTKTLNLHH